MSKMYAFHGADNKTGTTMITQSVAEFIADNLKDIKIMMISLHGRSGTEYVDRVGESIEGLKLHLSNRLLDFGRVIEGCRRSNNFYMLGGVESIGQVRSYHPDMATYLLESMENEFDLIFADTGNDIDNGLAVGALEFIEEKYCIITQQESILRRYERVQPVYERLGIDFSFYVVNKYDAQDPCDLRYIAERLCLCPEKLMKVEASGYERQAELDRRTLLCYKNEAYCKDIKSIANRILQHAQMDPIRSERKKKWTPFI
ncbi:MAG TPA: hypothetical protein PKG53_02405 [Bacillota bacterium]|nr:hypothetical protein [Bacillota bacterium]